MENTVSVSKGVFVFKNGFKAAPKRSKSTKKIVAESNIFSNQLWYQSYSQLWNSTEEKIEDLNNEMFSNVLSNLVSFIKLSYDVVVTEIPTAVLLTGINMPDHAAQFSTLSKEIKSEITPHVAFLNAQDCQNLKNLIENMTNQFVNHLPSSDEDSDCEITTNKLKKYQCTLSTLQAWYENLYEITSGKPENLQKLLVVIISDFESFPEKALQDFVLILSSYINILPFVLIFGVATSLTVLHRSLPYQVMSKINIQVFNSQQSTVYLNNVVENIFFTKDCPFRLGGKVFTLFTDIFLFYDLSVKGFIQNFKYAMLEHYCHGNAMALCTNLKNMKSVVTNFTPEDCENVRRLVSFRSFVESHLPDVQIKLLTDDDYFKKILLSEMTNFHVYLDLFQLFLKCLHALVYDLPKAPLGKQVRELYSVATSKNITKSEEYKECMALLGFQCRDEFTLKIAKIRDLLTQETSCNKKLKLDEHVDNLNAFLNDLKQVNLEEDVIKSTSEGGISGKMDRKQLKEKLFKMAKESRPMNKYEKLRTEVLEKLSKMFEEFLQEPTSKPFNEIYFFNDMSIKNHIIGSHRTAIHTSLNNPHYYLQCSCCDLPNDTAILGTLPDICIAYKLHLECGKMINLYDWLQAFLAILDPSDENEDRRIVDPKLQARFTQAVAELEYLGFIKSSKRKTDHVSRLTWGG